jgi:hypothetical protein
MKLNKIVFFVAFSISFALNAQNVNVDNDGRIISIKSANGTSDIEGSEYLNENFTPITITKYDGKLYNGRFNAVNGEIEVKLEDNKIIALDTKADFEIKFNITNKTYRTEEFINNRGITKNAFLVVVNDKNDYVLLKEEIIKFHKKIEATSSYAKGRPARYIRENDNYYIKYNDTVAFISQKKKDLFKMFPEQSRKIKAYIKENKISLKDEDDLIKIVGYLSTIK